MIDYRTYSQYPKPNRAEEDKDMQTLLGTFSEEAGSQQDQDFSQDDNNVPKKSNSKYSSTKVKTRNLLTFHIKDKSKTILTTYLLLMTIYLFCYKILTLLD